MQLLLGVILGCIVTRWFASLLVLSVILGSLMRY
jgi:hypothetical protein